MNKEDLFDYSLRALGMYVLYSAINITFDSVELLINYYVTLNNYNDTLTFPENLTIPDNGLTYSTVLFITLIVLLKMAFLSGIFWLLNFKTNFLIKKLKISNLDSKLNINLEKQDVLKAAFIFLGLLFCFLSILDFTSKLITLFFTEVAILPKKYHISIFHLLVPFSKLFLGVFLLLKSDWLSQKI